MTSKQLPAKESALFRSIVVRLCVLQDLTVRVRV